MVTFSVTNLERKAKRFHDQKGPHSASMAAITAMEETAKLVQIDHDMKRSHCILRINGR